MSFAEEPRGGRGCDADGFCRAMQVAKIIREDFLAQNAYSPYDPCCPFYKSVWMLKNMILFYTLALKSVELSGNDRKISLNAIKNVRRHPRPRLNLMLSPDNLLQIHSPRAHAHPLVSAVVALAQCLLGRCCE